jgi:hypothetical protein
VVQQHVFCLRKEIVFVKMRAGRHTDHCTHW